MMLDYLANMNLATSDEEIVQELGRVVTGFEIEYWNDSKIEDFYEAFSKMVTQLNNYQVQDNVGADEIKVTISTGTKKKRLHSLIKVNCQELVSLCLIRLNLPSTTLVNH